MRIAYHSTGASLTAAALQTWLTATIAALGSVGSPGVLITVSDPKRPYVWSDAEILADDRQALGGKPWARLLGQTRGGLLEFNTVSATEEALWAAWHLATYGGRVPFVVELPHDGEVVAVSGSVTRVSRLVGFRRHEVAALELVEWQA